VTITTIALMAIVLPTVALALVLDVMAVVAWISGRSARLKDADRP
jgi:hypothetical protein